MAKEVFEPSGHSSQKEENMQKNLNSFESVSSLFLAASYILLAIGFFFMGVSFLPVIGILAGFLFLGLAYYVLKRPSVRIIEVLIGSKPGSYLNHEVQNQSATIPVAILSTSTAAGDAVDFDATTVIASSVRFGPNEIPPLEDMADPAVAARHMQDVDGDGDVDFVLDFPIERAGITGSGQTVCITGITKNGETFRGCGPIHMAAAA